MRKARDAELIQRAIAETAKAVSQAEEVALQGIS